ncbi:MAG: DUF1579 domain-containing protein [Acaryochloris sp. RU_4_1]|nr:DUF1579 domain-containing protein [Acaryochloris sp. RU_4_1]NJR54355.1 DUF1579 domain-containing protein [Acaryochloris sp. CRU_2_0]
MHTQSQTEHHWLDQFVGKWICESECVMAPDQPSTKTKGTEVVRSINGLWIVAEGEGEMPGGETGKSIMTLGYNPQSNCYVGTFICSMMPHLWVYKGTLDAAQTVLTLDTEGPICDQTTIHNAITKYQDIITVVSEDHRILTSQMLGEDGHWHQFMTAHYWKQ